MEIIQLAHDELEALHLCDGEGKTQEEAGTCMGVSRGTVQRLLAEGRKKVVMALVSKKALAIGLIDSNPAQNISSKDERK